LNPTNNTEPFTGTRFEIPIETKLQTKKENDLNADLRTTSDSRHTAAKSNKRMKESNSKMYPDDFILLCFFFFEMLMCPDMSSITRTLCSNDNDEDSET
jgi:hypothetical protein